MSEHLQRMGITEWRLREGDGADKYFRVTLNNAAGKAVGLIVADVDQEVALTEQEALLQKIAQALTPHFEIEMMLSISWDMIEKNNYTMIIFLGDNIKKIKKTNSKKLTCEMVTSFSLVDLLQQGDHKKQLWSEIKRLRDAFS